VLTVSEEKVASLRCVDCEEKKRLIEAIEEAMDRAEMHVLSEFELCDSWEEYDIRVLRGKLVMDKDSLLEIILTAVLTFKGKFRQELKKEIGPLKVEVM